MIRNSWTDRSLRAQAAKKDVSLTDQRFEELLKSASSFFAQAEGNTQDERRAVIAEILAVMHEYGLSVEDLQ